MYINCITNTVNTIKKFSFLSMKTHDQHCLTQFTSVSIIAVWLHISAMITYVNISVFFYIIYGQILECFIFGYFVMEMLIKMVALGVFGYKGSYLSNHWNTLDVFINSGELVSHNAFFSCLQIAVLCLSSADRQK